MQRARMPRDPSQRLLIWLGLLGALSMVLYGVLLGRFPLLDLYTHRRSILKDYTQGQALYGYALAGGIIALFAAYALGAKLVERLPPGGRVGIILVGIALVCTALVFMTQSISSTDLYDYLFRGRMIARYQANTFVTPPSLYQTDPLYNYVVWINAVTAYGPIWEAMSWLTARAAGESPHTPAGIPVADLLHLLLAYKALATLGYLLCGAAIWGALGRIAPAQRWLGLYLWLWNPLAIWESAAAGHNDIWLVLPIVLAVWVLAPPAHANSAQVETQTRYPLRQPMLALAALTVGGLIKYLAFFLGPLALAASLRRLANWRERWVFFLLAGSICGSLILLAYLPFWAGIPTFNNILARKDLYTSSWIAVLRVFLMRQMSVDQAKSIASGIGLALLVLGMLWTTWRSWRTPERVAWHMLCLLLWFLFACNPWFQPWYVLWVLALVAIQPEQRMLTWAIIVFCCTSMLAYLPPAFVFQHLGWKDPSVEWHATLSALIYVPPLLIMLAAALVDFAKRQRRPAASRAAQRAESDRSRATS